MIFLSAFLFMQCQYAKKALEDMGDLSASPSSSSLEVKKSSSSSGSQKIRKEAANNNEYSSSSAETGKVRKEVK